VGVPAGGIGVAVARRVVFGAGVGSIYSVGEQAASTKHIARIAPKRNSWRVDIGSSMMRLFYAFAMRRQMSHIKIDSMV
jgi:hypothetical protein